jgi:hypothetical protein
MLLLALLLGVVFPPQRAAESALPPEIPPSYTQVAENELFQLYVDSSTLAFKGIL